MWSYYGAKTNLVDLYPKPKHDLIIEPFAGTARYSLKYFEKEVILVDKYPVIINIWKWLQSCSSNDIMKMPHKLKHGDLLKDIKFDCQEAKDLFGFIIGCGAERPRLTAGYRKTTDRHNHIKFNLQRIAENIWKIKHWKFVCTDYLELENKIATHFIDPPYQYGGQSYVMNNKKIDFISLANWCKSREGQVIVCENMKATWMNFVPIGICHGSLNKTTEGIWTNEPTHYNNIQQVLF